MKKYELIITAVALSVIVFTFFGCSGDDGEEESHSFGSLEYGGQTYKTIVIGEQTWMAENLNYKTETGSYCLYEGEEEIDYYDEVLDSFMVVGTLTPQQVANNCVKYGRLYEHETAKTACPSGWHLPRNAEWNELINYVGDSLTAGTKLKATKGWHSFEFDEEGKEEKIIKEGGNGTDDYGFSALPGGCRLSENSDPWGGCLEAGFGGSWWSADDYIYDGDIEYYNIPAAYYQTIVGFYEIIYSSYRNKGFGFSVRCVKD